MNTSLRVAYYDRLRVKHITNASLDLIKLVDDGIYIPRLKRFISSADIISIQFNQGECYD